jgi:hypothetical protein
MKNKISAFIKKMQFKAEHVIFAIAALCLLFLLSKQSFSSYSMGGKKEACCGARMPVGA